LETGNLKLEQFEVIKDVEKKSALEQSLRDLMLNKFIDDIPAIKKVLKLSIETCKAEICSYTLPVNYFYLHYFTYNLFTYNSIIPGNLFS
jgi:hypothetical protein